MRFLLILYFAWLVTALPDGWNVTTEKLFPPITNDRTCYQRDAYDKCYLLPNVGGQTIYPAQPECNQVESDSKFQAAMDKYTANKTIENSRFENCTVKHYCAKYEKKSFKVCAGCSDVSNCIHSCIDSILVGDGLRSVKRGPLKSCTDKCKPAASTYDCDFRDVCVQNIPDLSCGITFDTCYSVAVDVGFEVNSTKFFTNHKEKICDYGVSEGSCVKSLTDTITFRTIYYPSNDPSKWTTADPNNAVSVKYSISIIIALFLLHFCL
jgi:hypothetical protein